MKIKNIPLFLQAIWSTGFNLVSRILPAYFAKVASALLNNKFNVKG
jgi:hypothetical protein